MAEIKTIFNGVEMQDIYHNGNSDATDRLEEAYMDTYIVHKRLLSLVLPKFATTFNLADFINSNNPNNANKIEIVNNYTQPTMNSGNLSGLDVKFTNNGEIQGTIPGENAVNLTSSIVLINNGWIRGAGGSGGKGGDGGKGNDTFSQGSKSFSSSGNFIVPSTVSSVDLCMVGGGGAGGVWGGTQNIRASYGGNAGTIFSESSVDVAPGSTIPVTIGIGGVGKNTNGCGADGTDTKFGSTVAAGGKGGDVYYSSYGSLCNGHTKNRITYNGASRTTCGGSSKDGIRFSYREAGWTGYGPGGQSSGFGDGGKGNGNGGGSAVSGGIGAGGGAYHDAQGDVYFGYGGSGGRGFLKISWENGTTGGSGGTGGNGGNGRSFLTLKSNGASGSAGNPSSPTGGCSGGYGGAGGAGGDWGVSGSRGNTGARGGCSASGGAGTIGYAGNPSGHSISGKANLMSGSKIGSVSGAID